MPQLIDRARGLILGEISDEEIAFIRSHSALEEGNVLFLDETLVSSLGGAGASEHLLGHLINAVKNRPEGVELEWVSEPRDYIVKVKVLAGKDLVVRDLTSSDPYCVLQLRDDTGKIRETYKTEVIPSSLNPEWKEDCAFLACASWDLLLDVYDQDLISADDHMGNTAIDLDRAVDKPLEDWFTLQHTKSGAVLLNLDVRRLKGATHSADAAPEPAPEPPPEPDAEG